MDDNFIEDEKADEEPQVEYEDQEYYLDDVEMEEQPSDATVSANLDGKIWIARTIKNKWFYLGCAFFLTFFYIFVIILAFLVKTSDGFLYASGVGEDENEEFTKIYEIVEEVEEEIQQEYSVQIDKYLIISALTLFMNNDYYINGSTGAYNYVNTGNGSTTVIKNYATILAKYQIKTTTSCSMSSDNIREIASNDDDGMTTFTESAADKEKNYDCSGSGGEFYSISTNKGRIDDPETGGVFYWNLLDENFFNNYYPEYFENLAKKGNYKEVYYDAANEMIDYIYLYRDALKTLDQYDCNYGNTSLETVYQECEKVKVVGKYAGEYSLEEYVAGVIEAECTPSYAASPLSGGLTANKDVIKEAEKAFSVAVRSYTIAHTNGCKGTIINSSANQNFKPPTDPFVKEIVNETKGQVMFKDSKVVLTMYDSFKYNSCNGSTCDGTYKRLPSDNTHTVSLPVAWRSYYAGGHGNGMTQWGNVYLATQNKKYTEILEYFYDAKLGQLNGTTSSSSSSSGSNNCSGSSNNPGTKNIIIGDSRFVGMCAQIAQGGDYSKCTFNGGTPFNSGDDIYIAKSSMAYTWMVDTALPAVKAIIDANPNTRYNIYTNMGANDLAYIDPNKYITKYNELAAGDWKNQNVIVVSVNPVDESKYSEFSNARVQTFNNAIKGGLSGSNIKYCDTYSKAIVGLSTASDGLHFNTSTSKVIYDAMMACK